MLISTGPYKYIRHPVYVSFNILSIGFTLLLFDWILLILYIIGTVGLYKQAMAEEEALLNYFGDEYKAYMTRTGRFFKKKEKY